MQKMVTIRTRDDMESAKTMGKTPRPPRRKTKTTKTAPKGTKRHQGSQDIPRKVYCVASTSGLASSGESVRSWRHMMIERMGMGG